MNEMEDDMIRIDVHAHSTDTDRISKMLRPDGTRFLDYKELGKIYDKKNISMGILMPIISPENQIPLILNADVYRFSQIDHRFAWCCCLDPRMGNYNEYTDFTKIIEVYKNNGAVGVGEITANLRLDDSKVENLLWHCENCEMPITIHWASLLGKEYGLYGGERLELLEKMLQKYPRLVVIGHSVPFWKLFYSTNKDHETVCDLVKLMRKYPNLFCDTSARSGYEALINNLDRTYAFLDEFQDRIMFGLDIINQEEKLYEKTIDFFDSSYEKGFISKTASEKINYKNALALYGLSFEH